MLDKSDWLDMFSDRQTSEKLPSEGSAARASTGSRRRFGNDMTRLTNFGRPFFLEKTILRPFP